MILAVTGHRPDKLGGWKTPNSIQLEVKKQIEQYLISVAPELNYVIVGMSQGVDQWVAELCIENDIPFLAAVPFEGQEAVWPPAAQAQYHHILKRAFKIEYISGPGYSASKMHIRNKWMVDHCDQLLAVWDGTSGGTAACIQSAVEAGRKIHYLKPPPAPPPPPKKDWKLLKQQFKDKVSSSSPFAAPILPSIPPPLPPAPKPPLVVSSTSVEVEKKAEALEKILSKIMKSAPEELKPSFDNYQSKSKGWGKESEEDLSNLLLEVANYIEKASKDEIGKDKKEPELKTKDSKEVKTGFGRKIQVDD